jgi:hypothetical protein
MKEVDVLVNGMVGPSYEKGHIGFRYNQKPVPYAIGNHYGSIYHVDMVLLTPYFDPKLTESFVHNLTILLTDRKGKPALFSASPYNAY